MSANTRNYATGNNVFEEQRRFERIFIEALEGSGRAPWMAEHSRLSTTVSMGETVAVNNMAVVPVSELPVDNRGQL